VSGEKANIILRFAPRHARARMMAAVFLMQPLGQLLASAVGLAVLLTLGKSRGLATYDRKVEGAELVTAKMIVDTIWRYVIGVGAIPAFIAIIFRLTIPESPRYTLDVDHDGIRALIDTQRYYNIEPEVSNHVNEGLPVNGRRDVENGDYIQAVPRAAIGLEHHEENNGNDSDSMEIQDIGGDEDEHHHEDGDDVELKNVRPDAFARNELFRYFIREGNIKYLLGTSICWFLLDFACKCTLSLSMHLHFPLHQQLTQRHRSLRPRNQQPPRHCPDLGIQPCCPANI
jgi:PHS family inorganic phosphate transporter-like MFS transporter